MSLFDAFRYDGRRAVVAGGATGMGAAVVDVLLDAGAEVIAMDRAEITRDGVTAVSLDLTDKASIDAAVDGLGGPVDALFSCAGVADGTPGLERVNFIGHRHMIDRMVEKELLGRGSAIGMISSAHTNKPLPYDPLKDFTPIGQISSAANLIAVNPQVPAQTLKELIALAKAKPGQLKVGIVSPTASRPSERARSAARAATSGETIGLVKKEPALRRFSSAGSITIDFARRRRSTASRTERAVGARSPMCSRCRVSSA